MLNRYAVYLPETIRDTTQFQTLAIIEGECLAEAAQAASAVMADQWIDTATERGLSRRMRLCGLHRELGEDIETMRQRVALHWNQSSPYTYDVVLAWLLRLCQGWGVFVQLWNTEYRLEIGLELFHKHLREEILQKMREMIPAHMWIEVWLNYNKYGMMQIKTHAELKTMQVKYGEIRETYLVLEQSA